MAEPGMLTAALNWYRAVPMSPVLSIGKIAVPTPPNRLFHRLQIADLTPSRRNDASRGVRGRGSRGAWSIRLRRTEDRLCEHAAEPCSVGGHGPTVALGDLHVGLHAAEHRGGLDEFVERNVLT